MHSSRMRTTRFNVRLRGEGVCPEEDVCPGGVSRECLPGAGCGACPGGVWLGVSTQGDVCPGDVCPGGVHLHCMSGYTPCEQNARKV